MADTEEGKELENYSVGYGRPPVGSRFKKGVSGNPTGRPKGTPNFSTVLQKALNEKVILNENGKRRKISKMQALAKQLASKGASGDLRATAQVTELLQNIEQNAERYPQQKGFNELDRKTILNLLKRCEQNTEENSGNE